MGVAGRTAPGSGMEHTVSHLLEMADPASDRAARREGRDPLGPRRAAVGARARGGAGRDAAVPGRRVDGGARARRRSRPSTRAGRWARSAGATTRASSSAGRRRRTLRACGALGGVRRGGRPAARTGRSAWPARCAAAGAPLRLSELGIDAGTARWALLHCHLMRDRFTVADLAFLLGIWEAGDVDGAARRRRADRGRACDPGARVRRLRAGPRRHGLPRRRPAARRGGGDRRGCATPAPASSS